MLGIKQVSPQSAKTIIQMMISDGARKDIFIPSLIQLTAPETNDHEELMFETNDNLMLTRSDLVNVLSVIGKNDIIYDHTENFINKIPMRLFNSLSTNQQNPNCFPEPNSASGLTPYCSLLAASPILA